MNKIQKLLEEHQNSKFSVFDLLSKNNKSLINLSTTDWWDFLNSADMNEFGEEEETILMRLIKVNKKQNINLSPDQIFQLTEKADLKHRTFSGFDVLLFAVFNKKEVDLSNEQIMAIALKSDLNRNYMSGNPFLVYAACQTSPYEFSMNELLTIAKKTNLMKKLGNQNYILVELAIHNAPLYYELLKKEADKRFRERNNLSIHVEVKSALRKKGREAYEKFQSEIEKCKINDELSTQNKLQKKIVKIL